MNIESAGVLIPNVPAIAVLAGPKLGQGPSRGEISSVAYSIGQLDPSTSDQRLVWLDYAKGVGIILVVLAHTIRGLRVEIVGPGLEYYRALDSWIYSFHMPLFFFISGYLFTRRSGQPWMRFCKAVTIGIVVPYVVWSFAFVSIQQLSPVPVHTPLGLNRLWYIWREPISYLWFLYALFFVQIAYFLAGKCLNWFGLIALGALFSVSYFSQRNSIDAFAPGLTMGGAFFFLGMLFSKPLLDKTLLRFAKGITLVSAAFWIATFLFSRVLPELKSYLLAFVAVFGVMMTIGLCRLFPSSAGNAMQLLAKTGEASMAIYVAHTIFSAATRVLLNDARIVDCHIHVIAGTLTGLSVPMLLYYMAVRLKVVPFLGFGQNPRSQGETGRPVGMRSAGSPRAT